MSPVKQWLKPPRSLLLILVLFTLVSVSALAWFGFRLLSQERIVETQREQQRLEQAADRIAAILRGALAETGESLNAWLDSPLPPAPREGLVLLLSEQALSAFPAERLLYYPFPARDVDANPMRFAETEAVEFEQHSPERAAYAYEGMARSGSPAVQAAALVRLARALRNSGRREESRAAYARLAQLDGATAAGAPAPLVARQALCDLALPAPCRDSLKQDLLAGRWRLSRGQFEFYWAEASRLTGDRSRPPADALALAEAAAQVWNERSRNPASRGHGTLWTGGQPIFVVWRGSPENRAALLIQPSAILQPALAGQGVACAVSDSEGRILAGSKHRAGRAAIRTAGEAQTPWTLYVSTDQPLDDAGVLARQRFLLLGLALMVGFLVISAYFIARAIRRETEVVRMQSDFVSAVSHEFRSPLTSIRQLSELLASGRVPSEERKPVYYETLVRETARLQRLVEGLLSFGRMEAGARLYRFEELEAAAVVESVVAEFRPALAAAGRSIEISGPERGCRFQADPEAITVALRNLVDNAVKYSPGCPTVWVEWSRDEGRVAIRVRDAGPGISASERRVIFRKFVRGSAAATGNVKGSGVGLAMVRHIVAAHGGEIALASTPGHGATFTMLLPRERT
jgi:signal transduction histidine kinase